MFYEVLGILIAQAARSVDGFGPGADETPRGAKDLRRVLLSVRRIGAMWPGVFAALCAENAVLGRALDEARRPIEVHCPAETPPEPQSVDPLELHHELQVALDRCVAVLHRHDDAWARDALRSVRRGLLDAAAIEQRLIDDAVSHDGRTGRGVVGTGAAAAGA